MSVGERDWWLFAFQLIRRQALLGLVRRDDLIRIIQISHQRIANISSSNQGFANQLRFMSPLTLALALTTS